MRKPVAEEIPPDRLLPDEALAAHEREFAFETPGIVKPFLPPRQSRGDSRVG
jgi:hypothetical protein